MDTNNINLNGLPSAEELERLANAYFSAPPLDGSGISPQQFANPETVQSHLQNQGNIVDVNNPTLNLQHAPPSSLDQVNNLIVYGDLDSLSKSESGFDRLPKSESGDGVSPSSIKQSNQLPVYGNQTTLPSSELGYDHLPKS